MMKCVLNYSTCKYKDGYMAREKMNIKHFCDFLKLNFIFNKY